MQVSVKWDADHPHNSLANEEHVLPSEAALVSVWVGMLRVQDAVVKQLDAALQEKHHMPLSSFEVLLHLSRQPERRMRLTALAESVLLTQSGISRLIDRLEKVGWVQREPYPGDARGAYAVLTDEGLARVREAEGTHLATVRAQFLDRLTDAERTILAQIWERLLSGGRASQQDPFCEPELPESAPHEAG